MYVAAKIIFFQALIDDVIVVIIEQPKRVPKNMARGAVTSEHPIMPFSAFKSAIFLKMDFFPLFVIEAYAVRAGRTVGISRTNLPAFFLRQADGFLGYACFYYSDYILLKRFIDIRAVKFRPRGIDGSQAIGMNRICAQYLVESITQLAGSVSNPFMQRLIDLAFLHPSRRLEIGEPSKSVGRTQSIATGDSSP